jgi:hypothetical protein
MNKEYFISLDLDNNYQSFDHYYTDSKEIIFQSIVKLFKGFLDTDKNELILHIISSIEGLAWETDFTFTRDQYEILKRDVLPYFEDSEDFDTCIQIRELYKKLNGE